MPDLKCTAKNCINNYDSLCALTHIKVEGMHASSESETCCFSFSDHSSSFTNSVSDFTAYAAPETTVNCDAHKCVYNDSNICKAESICVHGDGAQECHETECASFKEK
ncbi:MAG: DUF1540 domain-containing protein [Clostridia bacterium]|nr:DUF1540 domain-containing protein [Clostridia bacterium]